MLYYMALPPSGQLHHQCFSSAFGQIRASVDKEMSRIRCSGWTDKPGWISWFSAEGDLLDDLQSPYWGLKFASDTMLRGRFRPRFLSFDKDGSWAELLPALTLKYVGNRLHCYCLCGNITPNKQLLKAKQDVVLHIWDLTSLTNKSEILDRYRDTYALQ